MHELPETLERLLIQLRDAENREAWFEFVAIYRPMVYRMARRRHDCQLLLAGGGVQTAVTREALQETLREFHDIADARLVQEEEFEASKAALLRQFPSSFESSLQVLTQLVEIAFFDLPDDYYRTFTANIEAVSLTDVRRVALERMDRDRLVILVVGDRVLIESGLRELNLPIVFVNHEGREM